MAASGGVDMHHVAARCIVAHGAGIDRIALRCIAPNRTALHCIESYWVVSRCAASYRDVLCGVHNIAPCCGIIMHRVASRCIVSLGTGLHRVSSCCVASNLTALLCI